MTIMKEKDFGDREKKGERCVCCEVVYNTCRIDCYVFVWINNT